MKKEQLKLIAQQTLPAPIHRWLGTQLLGDKYRPPAKMVDFGSLRRLTPISRQFGYDRGRPIGRYYVENFLARHADDIHSHVLEIGDAAYTRQFGGDRVTKSDVLHVVEGNPQATIVGDLTNAPHIPSDTFDCFILTQTLLLIYDVRAAIKTAYRILKPGGVLLATFPGICQIVGDQWRDYQCWSFTSLSAKMLFEEVFPKENIQVETFGNVLVAIAYLEGMATEELRKEELDYHDPQYQVTITLRAVKG
ncbi:MAG: methyltransferase domain-containing protein [Nostocaceae cyanobacterium]|nr:methyltransferase domain-containing protein [Nostocaceae cyanobacterium]